MFDQVEYVYLAAPDGKDVVIFGQLPAEGKRLGFRHLFQDRTTATKMDQSMLVAVPIEGQVWCVWMLATVPAVTTLPKILTLLSKLSQAYALPRLQQNPTLNSRSDFAGLEAMLADLPRRRRANIKVLAARLSAYLVEQNACKSVMILALKNDVVQKTWLSDEGLLQVQAQLKSAFVQQTNESSDPKIVEVTSTASENFETIMIAQRLGVQRIGFYPAPQASGYALILMDETPEIAAPLVREVAQCLQFSRPIGSTPFMSKSRKLILQGFAATAALWLLWPAPLWLTVTGTSIPDSTVSASVTTDATLQNMFVRVGDRVSKDQPIAQLFSASLEERIAQEILQIKVEEMYAQAAMSNKDFGAFQLAKQRGEIARTRLTQLEARIAQLSIKAPVAGLIVAAVPDSNKGAAVPTGSQIAQIQTEPRFLVRLNPARVDARILEPGMTGQIYFRGLADRTYALELITPPVAIFDATTRAEKLEAYAKITTTDGARLMGGLSGYARIQGPRQLRIISFSRYIAEYTRGMAWTYLGLPL